MTIRLIERRRIKKIKITKSKSKNSSSLKDLKGCGETFNKTVESLKK
jgi:hypothetical protein